MTLQFNINNIFDTFETPVTFKMLHEYFVHNYYNKIFIKKLDPENPELALIHNDYNISDNSELFNECKSIVISLKHEKPKIISYTHDNIQYKKISDYTNTPNSFYEEAYEGTMVSIFNYENTWYFTTSRCSSIDNSYFYHKNRTFGKLFDECINNIGFETREQFTSILNREQCYYFVIVHHENQYMINYSERYGENYAKLVYIFARNKETQELIEREPIVEGLIIPQSFATYEDGLRFMESTELTEGLIINTFCERTGKNIISKIHTDKYWTEKTRNPNYPNRWFAYLDIFKKDDPTFRILDYQTTKNIVEHLEIDGKNIDITGMIYMLYKGTADMLFTIVMYFTKFDYKNGKFQKINGEDYELIKLPKYGILRKQIATLQNLINKHTIRTSYDVIIHLKRYVSIEDFVGLMRCMEMLVNNEEIMYIKRTNRTYLNFLSKYLENIKN
jgi:hypothetical protein